MAIDEQRHKMTEMLKTDREFEFTPRDFEEVRRMIYEHAGISLSEAKVDMVYSRLARRLRATGLTSSVGWISAAPSTDWCGSMVDGGFALSTLRTTETVQP